MLLLMFVFLIVVPCWTLLAITALFLFGRRVDQRIERALAARETITRTIR